MKLGILPLDSQKYSDRFIAAMKTKWRVKNVNDYHLDSRLEESITGSLKKCLQIRPYELIFLTSATKRQCS